MIGKFEVYSLITAAGIGSRMKLDTNKQFLQIGTKTVLERTLEKFVNSTYIDQVLVVAREENFAYIREEIFSGLKTDKVLRLVQGGSSREESTFCGLKAIENRDSLVICHDAARPFVKTELIDQMIEEVVEKEALITAVAEVDTVKVVKDGRVRETLDRSLLYRVQTPQAFKYKLLRSAYDRHLGSPGLTDDASYVEKNGQKVFVLEGSYDNIKITNYEDLRLARIIAEEEDNANR